MSSVASSQLVCRAAFNFHPHRRMAVEANGTLTVGFQASGHPGIVWALHASRDQVEVLEPDALTDLVKGHQRSN